MKAFLCGLFAAVALASAAAAATILLGLAPVAADEKPSDLETQIFRLALRKAIARRAGGGTAPAAAADGASGEEIYRDLCAGCHGDPDGKASSLGHSFHPPAPVLFDAASAHATEWTEPQLVWIIRHGIRNTGMPAWGNTLSEDDIH